MAKFDVIVGIAHDNIKFCPLILAGWGDQPRLCVELPLSASILFRFGHKLD